MCQRYFIPRDNRAAQHFLCRRRSNKLILEPGILVISITLDLAEVKGIVIGAAIVISKDRAPTPLGVTTTVFVLKTVPQRHITQPEHILDRGSKSDGT